MGKCIYKIIFIAVLVGTILANSFTFAADMTHVSVSLSAQMIGEAANTTIRFRTPTGVDSSTDTIVIAWPAEFNVAGIVLTDMDLSHGAVSGYETDLTLAAVAGAGIWGASWVGHTLTLAAPTDAAAGEIGVNDYVVLEVGTHASFGGAGANQVVNAATAGSYNYTISGTFGDTKNPAVYVADNNTVAITGTVLGDIETICDNGLDDDGDTLIDCYDPDCAGNSYCVPPGGGGDTTPPAITNVNCMDITPTSFSVVWETNEAATSCSEYGETSFYELGMLCNMSLVWSHSVPFVGLAQLTNYHFRVISRDEYFNTSISDDYSCATLGDTEAPVISNIRVINITATSAEVVWDTNEPATSQVDYGLTDVYGTETPTDFAYVTEHHVILTGLTPNTDYHFLVRSYDIAGNGAVSGDNIFHTLTSVDSPIITDVQIVDITETSARVIWQTNEIADSEVDYGTTLSYEVGTVVDGAFVVDHSIDLNNLLPNTLYHIRVHSTDPESNESVTGDYTFTTLPDTTPPANVTDFTATVTGPLEITLTWINPTDADFAGVRICRSTVAYPTDPLTCDIIFEGAGTSFIDTDVEAGVTYYYTNFAFDTSNNFASGAIASARVPLPVTVTFLGHPEKRWPRTGNWSTTIEMELREPGSLASLETILFDTNSLGYGTSTMNLLEYGEAYDFTAKGFSHLRKKMSSATITETSTMLDFTFGNIFNLYAGDCHPSKDNFVNSLDISTLINDLMASERVSDLNNDSQVNSLDITIQMANLMKDLGDD
ncbi:MAG: hypothetical protein PHW53_01595 [Patescibacteria group bacterium]|nr:hypothetical protein [Patescibacteria group bacterium]